MPGEKVFHTDQERIEIMTKRSAVYEPWVAETMKRLSESVGGPGIADKWRRVLTDPQGAKQAQFKRRRRG
jgi:hypothetical protein